jgi:hypothetical protein
MVAEADTALRGRLALDAPADTPDVIDHVPGEGNGTGRRKRAGA